MEIQIRLEMGRAAGWGRKNEWMDGHKPTQQKTRSKHQTEKRSETDDFYFGFRRFTFEMTRNTRGKKKQKQRRDGCVVVEQNICGKRRIVKKKRWR